MTQDNSRGSTHTRQKLIDAVGEIILEHGFQGVGVNAVAKRAGVDKVLIYRYFEDLDGLLTAFAEQQDYYGRLNRVIGDMDAEGGPDALMAIARRILTEQIRHLRRSPELLEILRWELNTRNAVTERLAAQREEQATAITHLLDESIERGDVDAPALMSILSAGLNYLALRAQTADTYNGIPLKTEAGWERIENAMLFLLDLLGDAFYGSDEDDGCLSQ